KCGDFCDGDGYRVEAAPAHPGLMSVGIPWAHARDHQRLMQQVRYAAPFIVLSRDSNAGRVRFTTAGQPYFEYRLGSEEKKLIRHGMATVARLHHAAGAERIITLHTLRLLWARESGV